MVRTKKKEEFLCCSVLSTKIMKGLEFCVARLSLL